MTAGARDTGSDPVRAEAYDWIVRMHAPDAETSASAFQAWFDADPVHADVYRDLQAQWDRAKFLTHTQTGQARNLASVVVWHRRPGPRIAVAAAVILFVMVGGLALLRSQSRPDVPVVVAYATRVGEVRKVALADGSSVTLDAASSMRVSIGRAVREVRLIDGTARFDVKPDPQRSFTVVTDSGSITTGGGLFDVAKSAGFVRVTPIRGTVSFLNAPGSPGRGSTATLALKPGQRLSVAGRQPAVVTGPASPAAQDWTSGMLSFDNERLADAAAEFNRHNRRKIMLVDASLADLRITGAFHANDAEGFARAVAATFALTRRDGAGEAIELSRQK